MRRLFLREPTADEQKRNTVDLLRAVVEGCTVLGDVVGRAIRQKLEKVGFTFVERETPLTGDAIERESLDLAHEIVSQEFCDSVPDGQLVELARLVATHHWSSPARADEA